MPRTVAPPPTDRRLWRRVLARCHPDAGGSEELFVWMSAVMEHLMAALDQDRHPDHDDHDHGRPGAWKGRSGSDGRYWHRNDLRERIPYDAEMDHQQRILYALRWYREAPEPWRTVVMSLSDYPHAWHGRGESKQRLGATYKQLAYIAHLAGMTKEQRIEWHHAAESIGVSEAMAGHVIGRLSREGKAA